LASFLLTEPFKDVVKLSDSGAVNDLEIPEDNLADKAVEFLLTDSFIKEEAFSLISGLMDSGKRSFKALLICIGILIEICVSKSFVKIVETVDVR
jgi:hypothetical protein